jgi:hypothetical protein
MVGYDSELAKGGSYEHLIQVVVAFSIVLVFEVARGSKYNICFLNWIIPIIT